MRQPKNTDALLHERLLARKIIIMVGVSIKDRKLMIFAHETTHFVGKDKLFIGT